MLKTLPLPQHNNQQHARDLRRTVKNCCHQLAASSVRIEVSLAMAVSMWPGSRGAHDGTGVCRWCSAGSGSGCWLAGGVAGAGTAVFGSDQPLRGREREKG